MKHLYLAFVLGLVSVISSSAFAGGRAELEAFARNLPPCLDRDSREIEGNNNEEVLRWKVESHNQYKDRALVVGRFVKILLNRQSHLQLAIDLSANGNGGADEQIEIIYNKEFGPLDGLNKGALVAACGDYITSREQAGPYPPSPVGAIVHWVHRSNNPSRHHHGFVAVDGNVYGQEGGNQSR